MLKYEKHLPAEAEQAEQCSRAHGSQRLAVSRETCEEWVWGPVSSSHATTALTRRKELLATPGSFQRAVAEVCKLGGGAVAVGYTQLSQEGLQLGTQPLRLCLRTTRGRRAGRQALVGGLCVGGFRRVYAISAGGGPGQGGLRQARDGPDLYACTAQWRPGPHDVCIPHSRWPPTAASALHECWHAALGQLALRPIRPGCTGDSRACPAGLLTVSHSSSYSVPHSNLVSSSSSRWPPHCG